MAGCRARRARAGQTYPLGVLCLQSEHSGPHAALPTAHGPQGVALGAVDSTTFHEVYNHAQMNGVTTLCVAMQVWCPSTAQPYPSPDFLWNYQNLIVESYS